MLLLVELLNIPLSFSGVVNNNQIVWLPGVASGGGGVLFHFLRVEEAAVLSQPLSNADVIVAWED